MKGWDGSGIITARLQKDRVMDEIDMSKSMSVLLVVFYRIISIFRSSVNS